MPFTEEEKKRIFDKLDKLDDHGDRLIRIETKLDSGEKKFKDLKNTRDWAIKHDEHHKTLNWLIGVWCLVITAIGTWLAAFKQ